MVFVRVSASNLGLSASQQGRGRNPRVSEQKRTPPLPNLPPRHPQSAPLRQVLALGDKTLMDRAGEQGDEMPADFIAEVLAGDADGTRTGRAQNIHIQVVPLLSRDRSRRGSHHSKARTSVLILTL